jgi:hypothetical protein
MPSETPTDGRCNYEYSPDDQYSHDSGYCEGHPMDNGRCFHHGGQEENGGAPDGNENAVTHGAYRDHAISSLTEAETRAFNEVAQKLEDPEDAQEIAREAAAYCLMMAHRASDDRWVRRWEGICDKFGIAPEEVQEHNVSGELDMSGELDVSGGFDINITHHRVTEEDLDDGE